MPLPRRSATCTSYPFQEPVPGEFGDRGGEDVEPTTERLLLILADISGYTRFMLASQVALVHGQQVITHLIEAILQEVEIPLEVKEIEGDAVFLYAVRPGDDEAWSEICEEVGRKLLRFFEVFSAALVAESESTLCPCSVCRNLDRLKLKIVAHSGEALFHTIGRFADMSGIDVILAHRLLKNSIASDEYLLMTEPAFRDLRFPSGIEVKKGSEEYEGFGAIATFVHLKSGVWEQSREAFFTAPLGKMLGTTLGGGLREVLGQFRRPARRENPIDTGDRYSGLVTDRLDCFQMKLQRGLGYVWIADLQALCCSYDGC
jgi:hypothetical protein